MPHEQRDNSGIAFQNDRKSKDTDCDLTGRGMVDGKMYWLNIWRKQGRNGEFFTISFKPMEERPLSSKLGPALGTPKSFKTPVPPERDEDGEPVPF